MTQPLIVSLLTWLALSAACVPVMPPPVVVPPSQPPTQAVRGIGLEVKTTGERPVADAVCTLDDTGSVTREATSDARGYVLFAVVHADLQDTQVRCAAKGFVPASEHRLATPNVNDNLDTLYMQAEFTPLPRLVTHRQVFRLENGQHFTAIQASAYNLLNRFLDGEDIEPVLSQLEHPWGDERPGANMIRVWTRMRLANAGIGDLTLADHPDLYERIPQFLRAAARHGIYVEFTAYIGPLAWDDFDPTHWARLGAAVKGETNVLLELMNENNIHPLLPPYDVSAFRPIPGVLSSHGSNGAEAWPVEPYWDYADFHTNGSFEEQRKVGHNAMEIDESLPVLTNETSRYPDVGMWAWGNPSLERQKTLARGTGAVSALLNAGMCFHSVEGKAGRLLGPNALAVFQAMVEGMRGVDLACQDGPYRHPAELEGPDDLRVYNRPLQGHFCIARAPR